MVIEEKRLGNSSECLRCTPDIGGADNGMNSLLEKSLLCAGNFECFRNSKGGFIHFASVGVGNELNEMGISFT